MAFVAKQLTFIFALGAKHLMSTWFLQCKCFASNHWNKFFINATGVQTSPRAL